MFDEAVSDAGVLWAYSRTFGENMAEQFQFGISTGSDENRKIRRSHSNIDIADINKVRRRRRRSSDIQREFGLLREERELAKQKDALKDNLVRLTDKVQKLKAQLARRRRSAGCREQQPPSSVIGASSFKRDFLASNDWDNTLDFLSHFFLVSLVVLLILWFAVSLSRFVAVYLLPELHLECAIFPGTEGAVVDYRARTALAWQLLSGHHPCRPVYLQCEEHCRVVQFG